MKKNIDIQGQTNRFWIRKLVSTDDAQQKLKTKLSTIASKLLGYKQQDILKKRFDEAQFVDLDYVNDLLQQSTHLCYYCQEEFLIHYTFVRDMRQWSLDRKNNDLGHIKGNVVVACLACNIQRRKRNVDSFQFTKQLTITQQDCILAGPKQRQEPTPDSKTISCRQRV